MLAGEFFMTLVEDLNEVNSKVLRISVVHYKSLIF